MPFVSNVVKVRQLLGQRSSVLPLLEHVLFLVPEPRRVDFPEIFYNEAGRRYAFFAFAKDPHAFRVHSEMLLVLRLYVLYAVD